MKEQTEWVPVKNYENYYEINQEGEVRSLHKATYGYIMEERPDRGGYCTVRLNKPGMKSSTQYVHRLLGFAFIPNLENKPFINHIDGNKLNNSIENLEWVTHAENMRHAYKLGLVVSLPGRCKRIMDKCSGAIFKSIKHAADFYMIPYSTCKNYLNGNRPNPTCLVYLDTQAAA